MLTVLLPAHNEGEGIAKAIESLQNQTLSPDHIVVIADNCSDDTVEIARRYPVTLIETVDNKFKKSGALNQGWAAYGQDSDYIFTMDADTILAPGTLENMVAEIGDLGAICARYWAGPGRGLAWNLQRLEYSRFDDQRQMRSWKVQVASGAAVLYNGSALREVCLKLSKQHPWDNESLIEDYALTLDLKMCGYKVFAASGAHVFTDTPLSFKELWRQRLRWGRGGIDEVRKRGWIPATRRDIMSYYLYGFGMFVRMIWVFFIVMLITAGLPLTFSLAGFVIIGIFWLDRVTSISHSIRDWQGLSLAGVLVVEDIYGFFLEICTATALFKSVFNRKQEW